MKPIYLVIPFAPLIGALIAGVFGRAIGRTMSHVVTIAGVAIALVASIIVLQSTLAGETFNGPLYTWAVIDNLKFEVGFLIDNLTATMMCVVTSVSLMVHIYTIGYMKDDDGYQRFFAYISLFTFAMLMLVMSNNFLQLFFGWEAVGLVSYLLIGFWYTRPTAIYANLKAFLVNRVGDFGFLLGIGLVATWFGSLDYAEVFKGASALADKTINPLGMGEWLLITVTCICLFIGAMGKSAQFPLHVWLPDSMEGPTPISALIHAATMVTAGIFMVARMSPLFELSDTALSFVMVIGAITALFMGFLGIVQNDIKRVVAYSTLSQLGYMTVALGASAYGVAIFHLMTHAFFKALLFLAAGSVIIGMHHDQDIRHMGGLRKYMPITWITSLLGSLALIGTPFFSGFYSKDMIIEAVRASDLPGAGFASFAVLAGVFVTAFYSFRMYFLVFHGKERFDTSGGGHGHGHGHDAHHADAHGHDDHHGHHGGVPHESPGVITLPLVLLAIPSVVIGAIAIGPMLFGDVFKGVITVDARHEAMAELAKHFHGWAAMGVHALQTLPFWLAVAGVAAAYYCYLINPALPEAIRNRFSAVYRLLDNKYYLDRFNEVVFAGGARALGGGLWKAGDQAVIDGLAVNGSARLVGWFAGLLRGIQSGLIYHYAIAMIVGVALLIWWFVPLLKR
ncbi:MAG: NADH-quinone oxidoreductase subunit L [Burkholderiales bacterium]|nr:NADH-quinone oxidoreductase subunit L [Burkholderiales bacterium]